MAYPQGSNNAIQITGLSFSPSAIAWGSTTRCTVTMKNVTETGRTISAIYVATYGCSSEGGQMFPEYAVYGGPNRAKAAISWPVNTEKTFTFDYTFDHPLGGHEPDLSGYVIDVQQLLIVECNVNIDMQGNYTLFDDIMCSADARFLAVVNALDMPKLSGSIQRCRQGVADDEGEALMASLSVKTASDTATFLAHGYSMSITAAPSVADLAMNATPADVCAGIEDDPNAIQGTISNRLDYSFVITIGNGYESSSLALSLSRAFANIHLSGASTGGVAFGKFSASTEGNPLFECEYPACLHGGAQVDGALSVYGEIKGVTDYTVGEVATGAKWVDGLPIYRRVILLGAKTGSSLNVSLASYGIRSLISFRGIACTGSNYNGYSFPIPNAASSLNYMTTVDIMPTGNLTISSNSRNFGSGVIVLEYTKNADYSA